MHRVMPSQQGNTLANQGQSLKPAGVMTSCIGITQHEKEAAVLSSLYGGNYIFCNPIHTRKCYSYCTYWWDNQPYTAIQLASVSRNGMLTAEVFTIIGWI